MIPPLFDSFSPLSCTECLSLHYFKLIPFRFEGRNLVFMVSGGRVTGKLAPDMVILHYYYIQPQDTASNPKPKFIAQNPLIL